MRRIVLLVLLLTSCAGLKTPTSDSKYGGGLPTHRCLVAYRSAIARSGITSAAADDRTRSWVKSIRQVLTMNQQSPIRRKTDLVYLASLPARRGPNTNGDLTTLPPLQFFLTVDNQGDSSRV